ncbi:hypothetical protein ACLOJK_010823 [Asimina triloba]
MAFLAWVLAVSLIPIIAAAERPATALFVFGDSLVDPGNNNNLITMAKGNFHPNGIDFPAGPTRRFSNGAAVADYLGDFIGLPDAVRYADLGEQGVNYASGGAGILSDTLTILVGVDHKLQHGGEVGDFLAKSLFFICIGSDDYLNNYLLTPITSTQLKYTPSEFHEVVIQKFREQLERLYDTGGRKFLIPGLGHIGCIPFQIVHHSSSRNSSGCVESSNEIALQYDAKLRTMVGELNDNLPASYFPYCDTYSPFLDVVQNPNRYGYSRSLSA